MRYHRLSKSDLEEMRDEFVTFLAAQSIRAGDWEKMKAEDPEKVEELLDQFSDVVIHRALENISALKLISDDEMFVFLFEENEAKVVQLKVDAQVGYPLSDPETIQKLAKGTLSLSDLKPVFEKGKKTLSGNREMEMYRLMRQGAEPCTAKFYEDFKRLCE